MTTLRVERYRHWMTLLFFQSTTIDFPKDKIPVNSFYFLFPILIVFGIRNAVIFNPNRAIAMYITLTIVWVTIVTNLIEFGENNRIRCEVDPLIAILFAAAIQSLLDRKQIANSPRRKPGVSNVPDATQPAEGG